ncbi:hypothetical protein SASPL_120563 [Salvia splendens]|uniref:Uncharacterized protein n=1 Tax=Salvia splendens TaxID=180675 RepID=A0A8X8XQR5_SALSN|nr:hypothetical protein SASPL_120563 [Salvia splendens]
MCSNCLSRSVKPNFRRVCVQSTNFEGVERGSESDKLDSGGIGGVSEYSALDNVSGTEDSVCNKENECFAVAKSMLSAAEISDGVNFVKLLASARFTHRCVSEKFR